MTPYSLSLILFGFTVLSVIMLNVGLSVGKYAQKLEKPVKEKIQLTLTCMMWLIYLIYLLLDLGPLMAVVGASVALFSFGVCLRLNR